MAMTAQQFLEGYKLRNTEPKNLCACGQKLHSADPVCGDCRLEELGEIVEKHPIVSPRSR